MANVINMGAGGASFVNGTICAQARVVYSDGYEVQDKTATTEEIISPLCNSFIYVPSGFDISPATETGVDNVYFINDDFTVSKSFDATFANNTWEDIILACQTKKVPTSWAVGNSKQMSVTIGGTNYNLQIDIIGKNHDDYADGSGKAPLTLQFKKCIDYYTMHTTNTNSVGWKNCNMRTFNMPTLKNYLPTNVRNAIKAVSKKTASKGGSSTIVTTSDELFLLSTTEVLDRSDAPYCNEGSQYEYYATNSNRKKVNYQSTSTSEWWCRSPRQDDNVSFNTIAFLSNEGVRADSYATNSKWVCPAFCF